MAGRRRDGSKRTQQTTLAPLGAPEGGGGSAVRAGAMGGGAGGGAGWVQLPSMVPRDTCPHGGDTFPWPPVLSGQACSERCGQWALRRCQASVSNRHCRYRRSFQMRPSSQDTTLPYPYSIATMRASGASQKARRRVLNTRASHPGADRTPPCDDGARQHNCNADAPSRVCQRCAVTCAKRGRRPAHQDIGHFFAGLPHTPALTPRGCTDRCPACAPSHSLMYI